MGEYGISDSDVTQIFDLYVVNKYVPSRQKWLDVLYMTDGSLSQKQLWSTVLDWL